MDLHQLNALGSKAIHRALHHRDPGLLTHRPNLGGDEERIPQTQLGGEFTDHAFGAPVHWRGVNDLAAVLYKKRQHFCESRSVLWRKIDIEHAPGSEPNDRKFLARR